VSNPDGSSILKAQQGDAEAFTVIVETYQKPVYNLCFRMLGTEQEAEDAAQETFWRAYQNLNRYDSTRPFITWVLSIAAHHCIDQQRRRRFISVDIDDLAESLPHDRAIDPEWAACAGEHENEINDLLHKLDPKDRAAIIMKYWYDFSEIEISTSLGFSVSAVKSRLFRARRQLAKLMTSRNGFPVPSEKEHYEPSTLQ